MEQEDSCCSSLDELDFENTQALRQAVSAANLAEQRLREAINLLPQGVVFLDADGRYILWNEQYAEIYATSADLLEPGERFADTLRVGIARGDYPDALGREEDWLKERLALLDAPASRHEQRLANGRHILIEERKTADGGTIGLRVDITDLRESEEAFRLLFERNPVPTLVYDIHSGQVRSANPAASSFFGYDGVEMNGLAIRHLFVDHEWDAAEAMLADDHGDADRVWQMRLRDGRTTETMLATRLSQLEGFDATIVSVFDITERRRIEQRMAHMATHDELTGLANRAFCREHLRELLAPSRCNETVTIALLDLDHFKAVNDTYGHHLGDALLTEAARRMRELIPPEALLCRIGGDEFAIIFRRTSRTQAEIVSRSIISSLSRPFLVQGNQLHIGATIGFATSPYDSSDPETLLRYADLALYAAKAAGKGCFRFFAPEMHESARERQRMESDLRVALEKGQLRVVFQPSVDASTEAVVGFEALIRWDHPEHGPISPAMFIPLAEEIGLINEIGEWVLRTACAEAAKWPQHISVAVNLSPIQFKLPSLPATVRAVLSETDLPAKRLELEITEGVFLSNDDHVHEMIGALKAIGLKLALDDFGTGYSSLSYLLRVPFDKIKVDQSFVRGASDPESRNAALIRAMVGLAADLTMVTTAEGVETADELMLIRSLGCTLVQGYYFGKPMPAEEARELAAKGSASRPDAHLAQREPRIRIIRAALLHYRGQVKGARLRNISSGGALVESREELEVGSEIQLDFAAGGLIDGTIVWARSSQVGVQFREKFDLKLLQSAKPTTKASAVMTPDYVKDLDASQAE